MTIEDSDEKFNKAVELLRNEEVVGMPTETVYGLAGNALSPLAVSRIFEAKGRPTDNPLIVHISEFSEIYDLVKAVPEEAKRLAEKFWPGPLTIILPKADKVPYCTTGNLETVAVRCPSHEIARRLIKLSGLPLAAPSANLSGKPSPTKADHVYEDLKGRIPFIIDGGDCAEGVESTVITLAGDKPRLLRPGNVTLNELVGVLGEVEVDDAVLNPLKSTETASSPGMKYKHYSPDAKITLVKGSFDAFCEFVNAFDNKTYAMIFNEDSVENLKIPYIKYGFADYKNLAHNLFDSLRELDKIGAKQCFVRYPDDENKDNLAVLNRLLRAAGFNVIEV
ncbi:MAG: threonylcarbamoyl-AMP synthase [Clostridia bacterium]|nr:threonylcarbamoyl-AMP synthase [Clostridia bacterium]